MIAVDIIHVTGQPIDKACHLHWYGVNCTTYCMEKDDIGGYYFCNQLTGLTICHPDWYGNDCMT